MTRNTVKTDPEHWEAVRSLIPDFMAGTYVSCEGWKCGVTARSVLVRFHSFCTESHGTAGDISFHTFYNELRRLGYELPVVKNYDQNTRVKGIIPKENVDMLL